MVNNDQTYQHKNTLLINAIVIFVSIVAAVVTSAIIVTSMVRGEVANAVAKTNQTNSPTYSVAPPTGSCSEPKDKGGSNPSVSSLSGSNFSLPSGVENSFNNTNTSTTNITKKYVDNSVEDSYNDNENSFNEDSNVDNEDSFNEDSYNDEKDVDVDVEINGIKNVNSNNPVVITNTKVEDNDGVDIL